MERLFGTPLPVLQDFRFSDLRRTSTKVYFFESGRGRKKKSLFVPNCFVFLLNRAIFFRRRTSIKVYFFESENPDKIRIQNREKAQKKIETKAF